MIKTILDENRIGKEIGNGIESNVFLYTDKDGIERAFKRFKIYNSNEVLDSKKRHEKEEKLEILSSLNDPGLVKIRELLFKSGKLMGYTMDYIEGEEIRYFSKRKDIIPFLEEIKDTLIRLNNQGVYIGDFSSNNIIKTNNGIIHLDIDNYRIEREKTHLDFNVHSAYITSYIRSGCPIEYLDRYCYNIFVLSLLGRYALGYFDIWDVTLPRSLKGRTTRKNNYDVLEEMTHLNSNEYTGRLLLLPKIKEKQ